MQTKDSFLGKHKARQQTPTTWVFAFCATARVKTQDKLLLNFPFLVYPVELDRRLANVVYGLAVSLAERSCL